MTETRRDLLALGAVGVGAAALGACATCPPSSYPDGPHDEGVLSFVDAHCHLFNARDLSAVRFISYVILEQYPAAGPVLGAHVVREVEDPTPLDRLVQVVLAVFGAELAPAAEDERRQLAAERLGRGRVRVPSERDLLDPAEDRLTQYLGGRLAVPPLRGLGPREAEEMDSRLRRVLAESVVRDGLEGQRIELLKEPLRRRIARRLLDPAADAPAAATGAEVDFPAIFTFIGLFRRHRHCLVEKLTALHRDRPVRVDGATARANPQLLVPAMVDYGRWLGQDPEAGSSFVDQVNVWTEIARRDGGPAVHGYVAFCPLRQVLFEKDLLPPDSACRDEPLAVVRTALGTGGFLGVKLYPPMGFSAAGNKDRDFEKFPIPDGVLEQRFGTVDRARMAELAGELDQALDRVYGLCHEIGAPIMAHGGNSVAANRCTGQFADPWFWRPVFDRVTSAGQPAAPAIMLAHIGGFNYRTAEPRPGAADDCDISEDTPMAATWEYSLCRYIEASRRDGRVPAVFADVSMFSEVLKPESRARAMGKFREMMHRYGFMSEHLIYGTDWSMLAMRNGASRYTAEVWSFLDDLMGGDARAVMRGNFLRYSGLAPNSPAFDRLAAAYADTGDREARLKARLAAAVTS